MCLPSFHMSQCRTKRKNTELKESKNATKHYKNHSGLNIKESSDDLKDGRFSFRGKLEEVPLRMSVLLRDSALYGNLSFWVGEPLTKIEGDKPCVALWKVKSS